MRISLFFPIVLFPFAYANNAVAIPSNQIVRRSGNLKTLSSVPDKTIDIGWVPALNVCGLAVWQKTNSNSTHILTAFGGESFARMQINDRTLQLRNSSGVIAPEQTTQPPSRQIFHNADRTITVTLQGTCKIEFDGAEAGWILPNGTLTVSQGNDTKEVPVSASLGCGFLYY
ncbi:MAG: hypothetical protein SVX43_07140 [Cyanobacteriota bacterium]|nr:hypothetical protein [Cyanobacteriota bacterium]